MNKDLIKLCIDTYKGKVENFSINQSNEAIRKSFVDIVGSERPSFREFRRHKIEIFEIIETVVEQLIVEGWGSNPFFNQFVEERNLNAGDKNEFYVEDKSLLAVSRFSGNHWDLRRQKLNVGESFSVKTEWHGVKIYEDFLRLLSGRVDWVGFIDKVQRSFQNAILDDVYTSFMGASAYLPSQFKQTGTFSEEKMLELCSHVEAACGNNDIAIVGTKLALNKMTGTISKEWISEKMKNDKNITGTIPDWNGYKIMEIPQVHQKGTFDFKIDDKKLMVIPLNTKPIKLVHEGEALINDNSDGTRNMDNSVEYTLSKCYGVSVVFNVLYGDYKLS